MAHDLLDCGCDPDGIPADEDTPLGEGTASIADAVAGAEVVLLAEPGAAAKELVAGLGEALAGKVVIDATNDD